MSGLSMRRAKSARWGLIVPLLLALAGCMKGDADLRKWVADEKNLPGGPLPPLPVLKTFETFEYKAQAQRDPFAPSLAEQKAEEAEKVAMPDPHPKEKLEDFALDSLKMVGTIGAGASMLGLIRDPEGTVSTVRPGNYVGQNNGKIKAVSANSIDLVELISNGNGGWMERPAAIEIGANAK
ncbi:MAG: pilus assembly protein PilP [Rudaea sp.]|uniref:pilus assembly protein PilP n=1 Tax=unclassified Rudaea TaxID=2627037 RepID=UPI0010F916C4|nr:MULTISPECIES: pilus assembly protein PilP [unclassified Rudaea]MBN8885991.1 pilus assembly protein PilP [Rudaea sp.]MBR0347787.1 pilus assembly protein PilP [Rudaea sp.]